MANSIPPDREGIKVFIDLETTGKQHWKHGVWQIAGCILDSRREKPVEFNIRVKPFKDDLIEDEAAQIAGYPDAKNFAGAMQADEEFLQPHDAFHELLNLFGEHVDKYNPHDKMLLYGWNVRFDEDFLRKWWKKMEEPKDSPYFGSWFFVPSIDVGTLVAEYLRDTRHTGIAANKNTEPRRGILNSWKLESVAAYFGLDVDMEGFHDAAYDADITLRLYKKVTGHAE
jgi:DNA polymerase III epsilon subunit-like protein